MSNALVTLNVGGVLYTTTMFTLQKYPDSMLGAMMNGKLSTTRDAQGNIFIDRDGGVFKHVLNFLRTSALCIPSDFQDMELLRADADFYQIEPLVNLLAKDQQDVKSEVCFLEVIEVRTGSIATMPTNNSRVKTILSGRKAAILSLPPSLIGYGVSERLHNHKDPIEHAELELYGSNIRLRIGEALERMGWLQAVSSMSTSSVFDARSIQNSLVIEHSYRDRWRMTVNSDESFTIHPDHLNVQTESDTQENDSGPPDYL